MLLDYDNPDPYEGWQLPRYYNLGSWQSPMPTITVRADGYDGRPGWTASGGDGWIARPLTWPPAIGNGFFMGARFLFEQYPASPALLLGTMSTGGDFQSMVVLNPDGSLSFYNGELLEEVKGPTNTVLELDTFYRLGMQGYIHPTAGTMELYLNRTRILNHSGKAGAPTGVADFGGYAIGIPEDSAVNHAYVGDARGYMTTVQPAFIVLPPCYPAAAGPHDEWTPSTGASSPAVIDEATANDDTDTLDATATDQAFAVSMDPVGDLPVVHAVKTTAVARYADDVSAGSLRLLVEEDGVLHGGAVLVEPVPGQKDWPLYPDWQVFSRLDYYPPTGVVGWNAPGKLDAARFGAMLVE